MPYVVVDLLQLMRKIGEHMGIMCGETNSYFPSDDTQMKCSILAENPHLLKFARKIYRSSFPRRCIRSCGCSTELVRSDHVIPCIFLKDEMPVGMAYLIDHEALTMIMYLVVDPEQRSKGFGSMILDHIKANRHGDVLVLKVDKPDESEPDNDIRLARMRFYDRNDFKKMNYYMTEDDSRHDVLSWKRAVELAEMKSFMDWFYFQHPPYEFVPCLPEA